MQEHPQQPMRSQTRPRRLSAWKVVLVILLVLVLAVAVLVGMTGLVPGLSAVVGANKPRDLGVQATHADYDRVVQEVQTLIKKPPASGGTAAAPAIQRIDREFTEAELSALLLYNPIQGWPTRNAQVRIGADGTVEISMAIAKKSLPAELVQYLPRSAPEEVPVYVKGLLGIAGQSELTLDLQRLEVGRILLPLSLFETESLTDQFNKALQQTPGLVVEDLTFRKGAVRIQGSYTP